MTTPRRRAANRANAAKSTGPRTDAGKAAARMNAVAHGLRSAAPVVPGERPEDWEAFRDGVAAALGPVGALEAELADRAASLAWRLRRGPWRKRRGIGMRKLLQDLSDRIDKLKAAGLQPAVRYAAPADDPEAAEAFEQARAGDAAALARLPELIAGRGWVDWVGDLGRQATHQLVHAAAGGDPVWKAGLAEKVKQLRLALLGPDPTVMDEILVRRIVNAWVSVHILEVEQAVRPPADPRLAGYLDRRLTQAQRRQTDACRALAAVRRRPVLVNVAAGPMVITIGLRSE